jgi:hypothetical protein
MVSMGSMGSTIFCSVVIAAPRRLSDYVPTSADGFPEPMNPEPMNPEPVEPTEPIEPIEPIEPVEPL